jgi:hypothetical protein
MKRVIHAELRKESITFDGWSKYEIKIEFTNGETDLIPAYGKDLQDALSRVVHDEQVDKIEEKTKRIPDGVWLVLWFGYIMGWTLLTYEFFTGTNYTGLFFLIGIGIITTVTLYTKSWFRKRNVRKSLV